MSVWSAPTYKLDVARAIYSVSPDLLDRALGPTISPYLNPDTSACQFTKEDLWCDLAHDLHWNQFEDLEDEEVVILSRFFEGEKYIVGIPAVYRIISAVQLGRFNASSEVDLDGLLTHLSNAGEFICPSTQIGPRAFKEAWGNTDRSLMLKGWLFELVANGFKRVRMKATNRHERLAEIPQKDYFGQGNRCYYGVSGRGIVALKGAAEYVNQVIIMTPRHVSVLCEALQRIANIYYYMATLPDADKCIIAGVQRMLDLTISSASKAKMANSGIVVRAFHKARAYSQFVLFDNVNQMSFDAELASYRQERLDSVVGIEEYMATFRDLPKGRWMEVIQVYKWMPPPDFDTTRAFGELKGWHNSTRMSGADNGASEQMRTLWESVKVERKVNLLSAFRRTHGKLPDNYPHNVITVAGAAEWDHRGAYRYVQYKGDIVGQVKDKAIVPSTVDKCLSRSKELSETSFLLWYMENAGDVDTSKDLDDLVAGNFPEENYVKVAYKPEASKENGRLFFIAPPRMRILLGEMEGNLSKIASAYPGSLQGKSSSDKNRIISEVMDVFEDPPRAVMEGGGDVFVVMFDCSKFSPKSNAAVTKDYHEFWAEVYNVPGIANLYSFGPESKIVHTTNGVMGSYTNKGADLEGFRGRMMTMFHADMLSAACRLSRDRGHTFGKAVLSVFIDDGAVKVSVEGINAIADHSVQEFLRDLQSVYEACGQENNPSKTCVSRIGGEMLAEQYILGKKSPVGIKAAMRIYPDYENPAVAITEELDSQFAACQGAVKDGGDWLQMYKLYIFACIRSIHRWAGKEARRVGPVSFVTKLYAPKSYGGFGLAPLQALVSTACTNATAEGLAILNRAGRANPSFRSAINHYARKCVVARSELSIFRDPLRVRANGPVLVENRLMMKIVSWLEEATPSAANFMKHYRNLDLVEHASAVARAILSKGNIPVQVLSHAWKATPLAFVESVVGKFKRAATIITLLGYKLIGKVRKSNIEDVKKILNDQ